MGYTIEPLNLPRDARLSSHNDERDVADREAKERFEQEVRDLIEADPDYRRVICA